MDSSDKCSLGELLELLRSDDDRGVIMDALGEMARVMAGSGMTSVRLGALSVHRDARIAHADWHQQAEREGEGVEDLPEPKVEGAALDKPKAERCDDVDSFLLAGVPRRAL